MQRYRALIRLASPRRDHPDQGVGLRLGSRRGIPEYRIPFDPPGVGQDAARHIPGGPRGSQWAIR